MSKNLSAGVYSAEVDASLSVEAVANGIAAYTGEFTKGVVGKRVLVTNTEDFINKFGKPTNNNYNDWFQVENFLKYGKTCYISRACGELSSNGSASILYDDTTKIYSVNSSSSDISVMNDSEFESLTDESTLNTEIFKLIRKDVGSTDDVEVIEFTLKNWDDGTEDYDHALLEFEFLLTIIVNYEIKEQHIVSLEDGKFNELGDSIFIEDVLLRNSNYLYGYIPKNYSAPLDAQVNIDGFLGKAVGVDPVSITEVTSITGGEYFAPTIGELTLAFDLFIEKDDFDCSIFIGNEKINKVVGDAATKRGDVLAILGTPQLNNTTEVVDYVFSDLNIESSYVALYGQYFKIYDKYNDKYRWINVAGAVAGSQLRTNTSRDPWWANAGIERGQLSGVIELKFNPNEGDRDVLQQNKVNPIVSFPSQGNAIIWGQKTMLSRPSAFNRISTRQLFLVVEKSVNKTLKYFVFEPNDVFTRAQVLAVIVPFLEDIKGRRGVYDFKVVCDTNNNTAQVIDANELRIDVLLKPTRVAEYISVRYIATKSGVDLEQLSNNI